MSFCLWENTPNKLTFQYSEGYQQHIQGCINTAAVQPQSLLSSWVQGFVYEGEKFHDQRARYYAPRHGYLLSPTEIFTLKWLVLCCIDSPYLKTEEKTAVTLLFNGWVLTLKRLLGKGRTSDVRTTDMTGKPRWWWRRRETPRPFSANGIPEERMPEENPQESEDTREES